MNALLLRYPLIVACVSLFGIAESLTGATFTYYYDSLDRLTNAVYSDGSRESYSYDASGNRLTRLTSGSTTNYDLEPPTVPSDVTLDSSSPSQMSISWLSSIDFGYYIVQTGTYIDGSGLAGYRIYVNGSFVGTTDTTNYTLAGLSPDTSYCLTVAAFDRENNVSDQSPPICYTTPVFQPPYLAPSGFSNGEFWIGVTGGTAGPYNVFVSSNLIDWQLWTNLTLPLSTNEFMDPSTFRYSQRFYELRWSTNTP